MPKPIISWPGGKRRLLKHISNRAFRLGGRGDSVWGQR